MIAPLTALGVRRWRVTRFAIPRSLAVALGTVEHESAPIEPGDALWFVAHGLDDRTTPWGLCALLPERDSLRGALLVVAPTVPRDGFLARLLPSEPILPRGVRGSALLLKGYTGVGGGVDLRSRLDLVWGS